MGSEHLREGDGEPAVQLGGEPGLHVLAGEGLRGGEPTADADPAIAHTYRFAYGDSDAFCDGNGDHEPHTNFVSYDEPNSFTITIPDPCSIPHRYGNVIAYSRAAHADASHTG